MDTEIELAPADARRIPSGPGPTGLPQIGGRDIHQAVTDRIIAALEAGHIPWQRPFASYGKASRHHNPVTGTVYKGINELLCWLAAWQYGFRSTRWVTVRWVMDEGRKKGVRLRKLTGADERSTGQKATVVIYYGKREKGVIDENGEPDTVEMHFLKSYLVFNIDQLDGVPDDWIDEDLTPATPELQRDVVDEFLDATGAKFSYGGNVACYRPRSDEIIMPHFLKYLPGCDGNLETALTVFNGTRFHELIHWTGAESRLDRLKDALSKRSGYAKEELVAELGAAFLSARYGYESVIAHASYIGEWLKALKGDRRLIVQAASAASKAVDYLDNLVNPKETL